MSTALLPLSRPLSNTIAPRQREGSSPSISERQKGVIVDNVCSCAISSPLLIYHDLKIDTTKQASASKDRRRVLLLQGHGAFRQCGPVAFDEDLPSLFESLLLLLLFVTVFAYFGTD